MKSPAPFVMSWNIQYLGSFPCSKITSESLRRKMEKVVRSEIPPEFVYLSISLKGVYVSSEDEPQRAFLAHSIRKVCCVFGKTDTRQVLYVTKKTLEDGTSKKECHIFRTENPQQVEEIESVLSSAFQRIVFVDNSIAPPLPPASVASGCSQTPSETTISSTRSNSLPKVTCKSPLSGSASEVKTPSFLNSTTPVRRRRNMSAAVLFQKFFGTPKSTPKFDETDSPVVSSTRKTDSERRRKRPVSAVFGQAMQKLQNHASNTLTPKKTPKRPQLIGTPAVMYRDKMALAGIEEQSGEISPPEKKEPALEFDDKLGEFVFPIDEFMDDQLQRLAYFCRNPNREEVYFVLQQMPEGAFILRYSESRKRCLALTVRVPEEESSSRISHFLIIRNEQGFRIKGAQRYFKSLPMLITHYTILPELLPCRLIFVEWDRSLLRGKPRIEQSAPISLDDVCDRNYSIPTFNVVELNQSPRKKLARKSIELCEL